MRFSDHPNVHRNIPDPYCSQDRAWIYLTQFRLLDPIILSQPAVLTEELQQTLYDAGGMTGGFMIVQIEDDTAWIVFYREGCEVDYHNCYDPDGGHDGSHEEAIMQVENELRECIKYARSEPLVALERVIERAYYDNPGVSFWRHLHNTDTWHDRLFTTTLAPA